MEGLSVAAATIQFIDFTSRLIVHGAAIHDSQDGLVIGHTELESITISLSQSVKEIQVSLAAHKGSRELTAVEKEQERISAECHSVANELLDVLGRLKSKGAKSRWKSFRQALKASWNDDKLQALEKRLDRFRQQMIANLLDTLRQDAKNMTREQASIRMSVEKIEKMQRKSIPIGKRAIQDVDETERWRQDLIQAIHNQPNSGAGVSQFLNSATPGTWAQVHVKLNRNRILQEIGFRNMTDRERRIPRAYEKTFEWIFSDPAKDAKPWSNFKKFLEQPDNDIYWITGKPGSGKSTLMKYIRYHQSTGQLLRSWSGKDKVIRAAFYFWNSGWKMQMSVDGLLQTILHECLEAMPSIIEKVLPERWEAASLFGVDDVPWGWQELSEALQRLIIEVCPNQKFFIMIDGLDECSGDHAQLIELVLDLAKSANNLKICVASRPWTSFEDAFKGRPHLMLQDLTHNDIKHYVNSKFSDSEGFCELRQREPQYSDKLLDQVSKKAEGVFLWVYLVVQSLLEGLTNGDRVLDLENRLSKLPPNLEDLFKKILQNLDGQYLSHASQLFQIVRALGNSATLSRVAFADMDDTDYALTAPVKPICSAAENSLCRTMRRRLVSRCRGMLDISAHDSRRLAKSKAVNPHAANAGSAKPDDTDDTNIAHLYVQYLHRSVRDFIETPNTWDWIVSLNTEPFNLHKCLLKSCLLQLKLQGYGPRQADKFWSHIQTCIEHAKEALWENESDSAEVIALLDEVDRTATSLTNITTANASPFTDRLAVLRDSHWSSYFLLFLPSSSFVDIMALCGVHQYLEARLQTSHLMENGNNELRMPLLFLALDPCNWFDNPYFDKPHPKAVEVILRKGGDINYTYHGNSVWDILRIRCSEETPVYQELYAILKEYGEEPPKPDQNAAARSLIFLTHLKAATDRDEQSDAESNASTTGIVSGSPRRRGFEHTETGRQSATVSQTSRSKEQWRHRGSGPQSTVTWEGSSYNQSALWAPSHQEPQPQQRLPRDRRHRNTAVSRHPKTNRPIQRPEQIYPAYTTYRQHVPRSDYRYNNHYIASQHHSPIPAPPWQGEHRPHWPPGTAYIPVNQYYAQQPLYSPPAYVWGPPVGSHGNGWGTPVYQRACWM